MAYLTRLTRTQTCVIASPGTEEDRDSGGDGTPDAVDKSPDIFDSAGTEDDDSDGDGIPDADDAFPEVPTEDSDADGNGQGDSADPDDDNDGIPTRPTRPRRICGGPSPP